MKMMEYEKQRKWRENRWKQERFKRKFRMAYYLLKMQSNIFADNHMMKWVMQS